MLLATGLACAFCLLFFVEHAVTESSAPLARR
jgi:hypothetical protein